MIPLLTLLSGSARADTSVGGYLRIMTRPDFQGGTGQLGYWNLYGRLLNEGPYAALEFDLDLLEPSPGSDEPWSLVHLKVEGGSIETADAGNGSLANLRLSQAYVRSGNVIGPDLEFQVGTLEYYYGDLGLYDIRPAQLFGEMVGVRGHLRKDAFDILIGVGDAGYKLRGTEYNTIAGGGAAFRVRLFGHLELGAGGQYLYEPRVVGNIYAPYDTPGLEYEEWLRGEYIENLVADDPGKILDVPDPVPTDGQSGKVVAYLGFGDFGPLIWNNFFASYALLHPDNSTVEVWDGTSYTLYVNELTDERTQLLLGDEMQLRLWPGRLDMALAGLYGNSRDRDNELAPSDYDQTFMSAVLRLQGYLTETVHLLGETSIAQEYSKNGNRYREHQDSIFANTAGLSDVRGLEYGDTDTRSTWQGKAGVVLNPVGPGIFTRPSLRFLYGLQYSNQNNAFGNSFVDTVDQFNEFGNVERHWHHVVAIETEAWF